MMLCGALSWYDSCDGPMNDKGACRDRRKKGNHMFFSKITFGAAAIAMMSWLATPAFAGHNASGDGHGHTSHNSGALTEGGGHKGGTKSHGHHSHASHDTHGNKGGAERGLDRANDVAGSHGEEGRENAAAHHGDDHDGDHGSSHDADE
jgi:hypothetical protein